jgi:uncharacterized protein YcbK (DUF882 family)
MDMTFMQKIEALRYDWGLPLVVTSGSRCRFWNAQVGGAEHSQHLFGLAVDFHFEHPNECKAFGAIVDKHGFGGMGVGIHLVHVDGREGHHRWTYENR